MVQQAEAPAPDTITTEAGNVPEASPSPETQAETVAQGAEAAAPEAVETAQREAAAPETTPEPTDPFASLTDDELENHPRVLDRLRRREQSARDRATADAARRSTEERAQWIREMGYAADLEAAVSVDETGNVSVDRAKANEIVGKLAEGFRAGSRNEAYGEITGILNEIVPPTATVPQKDSAALAELGQEVVAGRKTQRDFTTAQLEVAMRMYHEAQLPEAKRAWEREFRAAEKDRQTVAQREAASDERKNGNGPTAGVTGGAGRQWSSQAEFDTAHVNGQITDAEAREFRQSGAYGALPWR